MIEYVTEYLSNYLADTPSGTYIVVQVLHENNSLMLTALHDKQHSTSAGIPGKWITTLQLQDWKIYIV
ncbi:unnamed protein product [Acanthoscelides obtectus]|uniref:Uncharacterized protein n=1 Tax=Acanthoscelides obtectus TaxID=200917 RepID=A0A9P0LVQ4_ACAOB|nr:unnamed protein product [Acanthoscelides obtectus]CAK1662417.1 hypothetical protein AOBTE_LOCUS23140 [Acanthoscelides obtectus]